MNEVEIIWPSTLSQDRLAVAADALEAGGVETTCRVQPTRRGPETAVLILMTTSVLEPFLKALFQRVGEEAYGALKRFVGGIFGHSGDHATQGSTKDAPDVVIFEATTNGSQFLFTAGLPNEAYKKAVELDPGAEPGRWMWDPQTRNWLRFESLAR